MQIETFKVFRDLVETASFSKAAEANGITQSAVSQQVRAVERKFQVRLIDRGRRYFSLTPQGKAFLSASRNILDAYEGLADRMKAIGRTVEGDLKIAAIFSIGLHELPQFLRPFRAAYPRVDATVKYMRSTEVYGSVRTGAADVGLVAYPARSTGLRVLTFWRDKLVMICPPDHVLARKRQVRLAQVGSQKFVAFEPDLPTRKAIDRKFKDEGVVLRPVLEFDNIETVKRAVEVEGAVSIVPEICVRDEVRGRTLAAVAIHGSDMFRPLGAVIRRGGAASPALKEFLSMLESADLGAQ